MYVEARSPHEPHGSGQTNHLRHAFSSSFVERATRSSPPSDKLIVRTSYTKGRTVDSDGYYYADLELLQRLSFKGPRIPRQDRSNTVYGYGYPVSSIGRLLSTAMYSEQRIRSCDGLAIRSWLRVRKFGCQPQDVLALCKPNLSSLVKRFPIGVVRMARQGRRLRRRSRHLVMVQNCDVYEK
ncbi:hypothetical protein AVEN_116192-1 [Araneus ventricosus]|uniref:Uncharacterized protein n=1 Tax=Araneus ventricosus TaxID=182803 RepID=A0A4Y2QLJ7_ARAVE|nr:hypothetical protein AVEN_116192-1 [Araneus ventricosus]